MTSIDTKTPQPLSANEIQGNTAQLTLRSQGDAKNQEKVSYRRRGQTNISHELK